MLSGLALLLLVCHHMRVQGKPRSQVGPATPLLAPGESWERVGIPMDAKTLAVRVALYDALLSVSFFWTDFAVRFGTGLTCHCMLVPKRNPVLYWLW